LGTAMCGFLLFIYRDEVACEMAFTSSQFNIRSSCLYAFTAHWRFVLTMFPLYWRRHGRVTRSDGLWNGSPRCNELVLEVFDST